jgi:hypothetical protein
LRTQIAFLQVLSCDCGTGGDRQSFSCTALTPIAAASSDTSTRYRGVIDFVDIEYAPCAVASKPGWCVIRLKCCSKFRVPITRFGRAQRQRDEGTRPPCCVFGIAGSRVDSAGSAEGCTRQPFDQRQDRSTHAAVLLLRLVAAYSTPPRDGLAHSSNAVLSGSVYDGGKKEDC